MADYTIKRNDTAPSIVATLSDQNGPINLSTATSVFILLKSSTLLIKTSACTIVDKANGKVKYKWEAAGGGDPADLATAGKYQLEFEIHWEDTTVQTIPNKGYLELVVEEDLGP